MFCLIKMIFCINTTFILTIQCSSLKFSLTYYLAYFFVALFSQTILQPSTQSNSTAQSSSTLTLLKPLPLPSVSLVSTETSSQHAYPSRPATLAPDISPPEPSYTYYILICHKHTSYGNLITIPQNLPHIKLHLWMKNMMSLQHGLSNYHLAIIHFSKYSHKKFLNCLKMGDW